MTSYADVVEGIRATIAWYTHALDDGRTDDIVATFCPDGTIDIPGMGSHTGHEALRAAYAKWVPRRPQRHLVVNTLVSEWNEHEANAVSDVVFLVKGDEGWAVQPSRCWVPLRTCSMAAAAATARSCWSRTTAA